MTLTISAKDLARYASGQFCPRCEWVRLHVKPLPFQTFPGIFSTIDRHTKLVVQGYLAREKSLPSWLGSLGEVETYVPPLHWSKFSVADGQTGVTLRGEPDAIFRMTDGSHTIVDYKTARYTPGQEALFEVYEAQLNGYAYIWEHLALPPVSQLALVYMEPVADGESVQSPQRVDNTGFSMTFKAMVRPVRLRPDTLIPGLLRTAGGIHTLPSPPAGLAGCKDCRAVDGLVASIGRTG